jgi:choline dehydrogenase-like flavoprotein
LPYFRKVESHFDPNGDKEQHGFSGPMKAHSVTSTGRNYPLRQYVKDAWAAAGVPLVPDLNNGNPIGLAEVVENKVKGMRQTSASEYPLNVTILTDTMVKRVLFEERNGRKRAIGVEIADDDNSVISAKREVIISTGTYRTPQVLKLSGIGPAEELKRHGVDLVLDSPDVGRHFQDHPGVVQWWKLNNPERGLAVGSPAFSDPLYFRGQPIDFAATQPVPLDGLCTALLRDDPNCNPDEHPLLRQKGHLEMLVVYGAGNPASPTIEMDGSHIMTIVVGMLPTSRGSITLQDSNPHSKPLIDPNYLATEADRYMMRAGIRKIREMVRDTPAGREMIDDETVEDGATPVRVDTSDAEIDSLVRRRAM